jgi:pyruvate/2-oxoglutarate/acetoin dehydrogenase E1 component
MGMSMGMALEGFVPITCYPRFDFLILATNQLVNHLDKISIISEGQFQPRVIIRTSIGSRIPLDAGEQHTQDHTQAYRSLLKRVDVVILEESDDIFPAFKYAYERQPKSKYDSLVTLIIEWGDHYNAK